MSNLFIYVKCGSIEVKFNKYDGHISVSHIVRQTYINIKPHWLLRSSSVVEKRESITLNHPLYDIGKKGVYHILRKLYIHPILITCLCDMIYPNCYEAMAHFEEMRNIGMDMMINSVSISKLSTILSSICNKESNIIIVVRNSKTAFYKIHNMKRVMYTRFLKKNDCEIVYTIYHGRGMIDPIKLILSYIPHIKSLYRNSVIRSSHYSHNRFVNDLSTIGVDII